MSKNTTLQELLGPTQPLLPSDYWQGLVSSGLPRALVTALAARIGISEKQFLSDTGVGALTDKKEPLLTPDATEVVLRVTQLLSDAEAKMGNSAGAWFIGPQKALKGRTPLSLVQSVIGFDYVQTAISRA